MTAAARALIAAGLAHDEAMTGGPWVTDDPADPDVVVDDELRKTVVTLYGRFQKTANGAGIAWMRTNLRTLLTGYTSALYEAESHEATCEALRRSLDEQIVIANKASSEVERLRQLAGDAVQGPRPTIAALRAEIEDKDKMIERLVARISATDAPGDIDAALASIESARAQIVKLHTELGEAKLVIEQQDRDLEAMRLLMEERGLRIGRAGNPQ
jgi:DNA repair exonuclease SbcCD ATPase subunit